MPVRSYLVPLALDTAISPGDPFAWSLGFVRPVALGMGLEISAVGQDKLQEFSRLSRRNDLGKSVGEREKKCYQIGWPRGSAHRGETVSPPKSLGGFKFDLIMY